MSTTRNLSYRLDATGAGWSVLDIAAAAALSVLVGCMLSGVIHSVIHSGYAQGGTGPVLGGLAMTVPVAWRRRAPLTAAGIIAAAGLLNWALLPPMVRCGPTLPAIFLVGYAAGACRDRIPAVAGLALCAVAGIVEAFSDPLIEGEGLEVVLPALGLFFAAGWLVRSRTQVAQALRAKSAELRDQREQTARLAVLADRARLSADLEQSLHAQLADIASAAATGLSAAHSDQAAARDALATIERDGRAVLGHMREVVGTLREPAPSQPQPTLARLPDLLGRATTAATRLTTEGTARPLPAGLELSGYRIVEHLLLALEDAPEAAVDATLRYLPDALELEVSGPPSLSADLRAVLGTAKEQAALHGGTVRSWADGTRCRAAARLPLISSHA